MRGSISGHAAFWCVLVVSGFSADDVSPSGPMGLSKPETPATDVPAKPHPVSNRLLTAATENFHYVVPGETPTPPVTVHEFDPESVSALRLPRFIIRGERPPPFSEREFYTKKGLLELAKQRYLTDTYRMLNPFGFMQDSYAMRRYNEDERFRQMEEMNRLVKLSELSGDEEETRKLQRETKRIFNRGFLLGERWVSGAALNAR